MKLGDPFDFRDRIRSCIVSVYDADVSHDSMSLTDLAKRSLETPNSAKVTGFFANFADPAELQDSDLLSDSSMMRLIGDGLCNDLLLSVYEELGLSLTKPLSLGCVTPTLLKYVESKVLRKALSVMSGDGVSTSFLDGLQRSKDVCKVRETRYSLSGSRTRIRSQTHSVHVVRNGREKRLLFNLATTHFSEVFATENHLDVAMVSGLDVSSFASLMSKSCSLDHSNSLYLARDQLHQYLFGVSGSEQYNWLVDTLVFNSERSDLLPHPLFSGSGKVIQIVSDTELTVSFSNYAEALRYEPDVYLGTDYFWLHDLASYSLLDIVNCRRMFVYTTLLVLSHCLSAEFLVTIRKYLSSLSIMALRSMLLKLLEFLTDLDALAPRYLVVGTPSLSLLQTAVLDIIYCSSRGCPVFDPPITFENDSFSTWLSAAKVSVSESLSLFGRNYSGYSVKHPDFVALTSLVNPAFLPLTELESAFSEKSTFAEPTMDTPLKLLVTLDSSGPTIALDSLSMPCREIFRKLRADKVKLRMPRYTPVELLSTGLCYDIANVAVTLHVSGSSSLNSDPDCALLMESVLMHFCTDYYTFMFIFNRFLYNVTSPPAESTLLCYMSANRPFVMEPELDLEKLLESYACDSTCSIVTKPLIWKCLAFSMISELHNGFMSFNSGLDYIVSHARNVMFNSSHHSSFTMKRGVSLFNFTQTRYGTLSDPDLKKPGNQLIFIVGQAQGSSAWNTVDVCEGFSYKYPNPRWAGISTSFAALQLLLNPAQPRAICRGKMALDFSPKITPIWLGSFLDTWSRFIQQNPQFEVPHLFISENHVYYGSPGVSTSSYLLSGYSGLPFVLTNYRLRFSIVIRKLLMLGQLSETTKDVKRYLNQSFAKTGKLVFFNNDPALDVNRYIAHMLFLIWELCDVLTLMKVPHNPFWPTDIQPWTFLDFNVTNKTLEFFLVNYARYSHSDRTRLVIDTGLDDGINYQPGHMHDFVGLNLTADYPYKLYHFNLSALGKKMMLFVQKDPRQSDDYFSHLIKTQTDPNSTYYPNVGYHEFSVVNSDCLNELYVAPFNWDL